MRDVQDGQRRAGGRRVAEHQHQQQLAAGILRGSACAARGDAATRSAAGLCVAAMAIMLRDSSPTDFGTVAYSTSADFKYLVIANGPLRRLLAVLRLLHRRAQADHAVALLDRLPSRPGVHVPDPGGRAASAELLYLAYNGDKEVTWSEACGVFGSFLPPGTHLSGHHLSPP
ncbi:hypothetical protein PR202_gb02603 [Eleusine coracana subsp. coracana]|uniref:Uncharacterized protein n=1 Tax=Eleusine coracana subsp. coracana TaxID=191504 RepID=A0AAV5DYX2_ELECO|nr:hypothetical protein PR202_gb02603 [Eleusine coracana subsp. coracana]